METFSVTTPIYYVNAMPHVGNLYTTLAADILARYYRIKLGPEHVFFTVGTDEHGQKVAESAVAAGLEPQAFADSMVPHFKDAWDLANIAYDAFVRTTDEGHITFVNEIFQKISDAGYVYKGIYEGLYCVGCEKFITESEVVNGRCPLHPNKDLIHQKEENYFFKLSTFVPELLKRIEQGDYAILPASRKAEIVSRLQQGVDDISISRESVSWGIPLPWDQSHTFYVWVEALFNYYTVTRFIPGREKFWPITVHLLGKDIIWFHAVIWQALLLAAGLDLPKIVFAHGFFTIDGQKISKSLGNVIAPGDLVARYSADGTRYLLMSAYHFGNDGDLALSKFDETYNADLAHGLGNLVARTARLAEGQSGAKKPAAFSLNVAEHVENFCFAEALEDVWSRISAADKYLNKHEPWKNPSKKADIMPHVVKELAQIGYDLQPFLPETSEKILEQFCSRKMQTVPSYFPRLS